MAGRWMQTAMFGTWTGDRVTRTPRLPQREGKAPRWRRADRMGNGSCQESLWCLAIRAAGYEVLIVVSFMVHGLKAVLPSMGCVVLTNLA